MSKTETQLTNQLCKRLKTEYGAAVFPISGGRFGVNGAPDRVICINGKVWLIEFKGSKTPIKPIQYTVCRHAHRQGSTVMFARFERADRIFPLLFWCPNGDPKLGIRAESMREVVEILR